MPSQTDVLCAQPKYKKTRRASLDTRTRHIPFLEGRSICNNSERIQPNAKQGRDLPRGNAVPRASVHAADSRKAAKRSRPAKRRGPAVEKPANRFAATAGDERFIADARRGHLTGSAASRGPRRDGATSRARSTPRRS